MLFPYGHLVLLPPNRVWRTYTGGRELDRLGGASTPADSHFPEDWIASTTRAINPGRETIEEGVSQVRVAGASHDFARLLATDPGYFLGSRHAAGYGASPQLLVKLLDPAIRLHFQVHPTATFARRFLNSPSGKTEAYHVLETRPEIAQPYIYLGFQHPPTPEKLKQLIEAQDIAGLEACFEKIPVRPGDTYLVPGGVPHALGEGILLVEIQEPSDLVVRFEFKRGDYVLPESARFMNRGLDFCLAVFDYSAWPHSRLAAEARRRPLLRRTWGNDSWQDDLITPAHTPCFRVRKSYLNAPVVRSEDSFYVGIVTAGTCTVTTGNGETTTLGRYDKFFCPAGIGPLAFKPAPRAEILECYPPAA